MNWVGFVVGLGRLDGPRRCLGGFLYQDGERDGTAVGTGG